MRKVISSVKANLYKMRHTKLFLGHILLPMLMSVIFLAYYKTSVLSEYDKIKMYFQVIAILYPLAIAIVVTAVYEADLGAGEFQLFRMMSGNKIWGHMGNLLAFLILSGIAVIIAVGVFGAFFVSMGNHSYAISFYIKTVFLLFFVNVPVYILQYLICYTFGKGVSLGSGVVGLMLGPLMYLGLGDSVWKLVPYSYGIRMISYYLLKDRKETPYLSYIIMDYQAGAVFIGIVTVIGSIVFILWGNLWQGDKTTTE